MKLNQFADVLIFKKVQNMYHKTTQLGRNEFFSINLNYLENFKNIFLIFHRKQRPQKAQNVSNLDATSKTKIGQTKGIVINYS